MKDIVKELTKSQNELGSVKDIRRQIGGLTDSLGYSLKNFAYKSITIGKRL